MDNTNIEEKLNKLMDTVCSLADEVKELKNKLDINTDVWEEKVCDEEVEEEVDDFTHLRADLNKQKEEILSDNILVSPINWVRISKTFEYLSKEQPGKITYYDNGEEVTDEWYCSYYSIDKLKKNAKCVIESAIHEAVFSARKCIVGNDDYICTWREYNDNGALTDDYGKAYDDITQYSGYCIGSNWKCEVKIQFRSGKYDESSIALYCLLEYADHLF